MKRNKLLDISLLIAVHHGTKKIFLVKSLKSVYSQRYVPKEIIIIIDGKISSKINTFLNNNPENYNNLKIIKIQKNLGLANALNQGILNCKYNLAARLDPDDQIINNRFKIQKEEFDKNQNLTICGSYILESRGNKTKIIKKPLSNGQIYKSLKFKNPIIHSTVMFRVDRIRKIGLYPSINKCQDYLLWIKSMEENYKFKNLPLDLVKTNLDISMMERRNFKYFLNEYKIYKYMLNKKIITNQLFLFLVISRLLLRSIPNSIKILLYNYR